MLLTNVVAFLCSREGGDLPRRSSRGRFGVVCGGIGNLLGISMCSGFIYNQTGDRRFSYEE